MTSTAPDPGQKKTQEEARSCILAGYGPEDRGRGGLELARMLGQSAGLPILVVCVIPDRWSGIGPGRAVDADYQRYLTSLAQQALTHAQESFDQASVPVRYEVITARSAPVGLLHTAADSNAKMLVCGSSADGSWGHVALGSVTDRLLHSSHIPVALAPRGQRYAPGQRVDRITVAVDGSDASRELLARAARVAADVEARLRVVSFAVRVPTMFPPELGMHIEDRVVAEWRAQAGQLVADAVKELDPALQAGAELHVSEGKSWADALEEPGWSEGDVLVIGSSSSESRLARVFLGSTAARIIRHTPVPVVVVP